MTRIQTEEIARQDFISGQLDAINSLPPRSSNYWEHPNFANILVKRARVNEKGREERE
jgi:hypothetical protein